MSILDIYEKVNLTMPLEQRRFFNLFDDTVNELVAMYNPFVIEDSKEYVNASNITQDNVVLPLYHNSIVDNILYLAGGGDAYKSEFLRKSRNAYLKYWNDNAKCRKVKGMEW